MKLTLDSWRKLEFDNLPKYMGCILICRSLDGRWYENKELGTLRPVFGKQVTVQGPITLTEYWFFHFMFMIGRYNVS